MSDIFISYASEDREWVRGLASEFEAQGWSVWWDRNIPTGRSFTAVIEEALGEAKAIVVVWTTQSIKKQWVQNEAREGMARDSLYPVMRGELKIPLEFGHLQSAQLGDWRPGQPSPAFDQLVQDLSKKLLSVPPSSESAQSQPHTYQTDPNPKTPLWAQVSGWVKRWVALFWSKAILWGLLGIMSIGMFAFFLTETEIKLSTEITGKNEMPMVLVEAGTFIMGSPEDKGDRHEHPPHSVYLDAFYIDQYEVTVQQYRLFTAQKNRGNPSYWDRADPIRDAQKPVVGISWHDANAYCKWVNRRLPTEAEWEKAARGNDKRTYPWGNSQPLPQHANFGKDWTEEFYRDELKSVGTYERGKSPYGAYDMAGNVSEWVADWYKSDYFRKSPEKNPQGPTESSKKVLRGGSWGSKPSEIRSAYRGNKYPSIALPFNGFRCAQDAP